MYSAPLRSVHTFLQATLHVWHPMHLSKWNTIEIWDRTFIVISEEAFSSQRSAISQKKKADR